MAFLYDIFHREPLKRKCWKAVGFKLFPDHWNGDNQETLKRVLADKRIKKIVLRREDYLAVYASKLRADKTGAYIKKSLDDIPLHINLSAFDHFIRYYDACYAYYDNCLQVNAYEVTQATSRSSSLLFHNTLFATHRASTSCGSPTRSSVHMDLWVIW